MLRAEKKQKKLTNSNVITRHNAIIISCDEQSSFSLFNYFPIKVNYVTIKIIKIIKIQELSSPKGS